MKMKPERMIRIYGAHAGNAGEAQITALQIGLDYDATPAIQTHNSYLLKKGWALAIMHAEWNAAGAQNIYLRFGTHATYNNALNPKQFDWYLGAIGRASDDYVRGDTKSPIYEFILEAIDNDYYVFLSLDLAQATKIMLLCKTLRLSDL